MKQMIITPLGTISPHPKKGMYCPGFLVEYNGIKYLLDCGNGITGSLDFPNDLENLVAFISHYHLDHIGDIGALQYASYVYHNLGMLQDRIKIFLPKNDFRYNRKAILANEESYADYFDITDSSKYNFGDLEVSFSDNKSHTIESFMIKIQTPDFKVVYTADIGTTNMKGAANFCQNSDLLICESSLLRQHNLSSKTHLTAYDAGLLAKEANVDKLLLTHFWPNEDKELYLTEAKEVFENSEVAREGQRLILRR